MSVHFLWAQSFFTQFFPISIMKKACCLSFTDCLIFLAAFFLTSYNNIWAIQTRCEVKAAQQAQLQQGPGSGEWKRWQPEVVHLIQHGLHQQDRKRKLRRPQQSDRWRIKRTPSCRGIESHPAQLVITFFYDVTANGDAAMPNPRGLNETLRILLKLI